MIRLIFLPLLAFATLGGCSAGLMGSGGGARALGPSGASANLRADQATQLACRGRANQVYDRRNRAEIYSRQSTVNTPFSADYESDSAGRALGDRFAFDRMVDECVRNSGTGEVPITPTATPATALPAAKKR